MLWPGHKLQSMSVITNNLVTHQQLAHCALGWGQQNINTDIITRNKIFAIQSPDIPLSAPQLLIRVVPHMDQMDRVLPYLAELGALHQRHGVAKQHIDLLGLAFCAAIRGVVQVTFLYHLWQCCRYNIKYVCVQGGGVKGGHLHETTKAWITLVQVRTPAVLQCVW